MTSVELAEDVVVGSGAFLPGLDARLALGSAPHRHRHRRAGGPLEHVEVSVYRQVSEAGTSSWQRATTVLTDASGTYDVSGSPAGTYRLGFQDTITGEHVGEFYDDQPTVDLAEDLVVAAGADRARPRRAAEPGGTRHRHRDRPRRRGPGRHRGRGVPAADGGGRDLLGAGGAGLHRRRPGPTTSAGCGPAPTASSSTTTSGTTSASSTTTSRRSSGRRPSPSPRARP